MRQRLGSETSHSSWPDCNNRSPSISYQVPVGLDFTSSSETPIILASLSLGNISSPGVWNSFNVLGNIGDL